MDSQVEDIGERVKSFFSHLGAEFGILDRIIYKNKNQHRRGSYFQYLLKVKRDLKLLLHSIHIEDLVDSCFNVITGKKAKQKANLLESLKRSKSETGTANFLLRLLGAARLLSEMVEPMLKAAVEISILLARSFFIEFCLVVLALLARLRVLVQQILLDVISVFNKISLIAQKKQSIKITHDGIEVFREYYPAMEEIITLEGVWKTDKFVLVESVTKCEIRHQDKSSEGGGIALETSVQYRSVNTLLGGDDLDPTTDTNSEENARNLKRKRLETPSLLNENDGPKPHDRLLPVLVPHGENSALGNHSVASSSAIKPSTSIQLNPGSISNKRVAFVSVKPPLRLNSLGTNAFISQAKGSESESNGDTDNPLFGLINGEDSGRSLF